MLCNTYNDGTNPQDQNSTQGGQQSQQPQAGQQPRIPLE